MCSVILHGEEKCRGGGEMCSRGSIIQSTYKLLYAVVVVHLCYNGVAVMSLWGMSCTHLPLHILFHFPRLEDVQWCNRNVIAVLS